MAVQPGVFLADPNTANQLAAVVGATGDGKTLTGGFELVVGNTPLLENASGTFDQQRAAPGATGIPSANTEGTKATYSSELFEFTPVATPTDFWQIIGSGTKTIRVTRISIAGIATSAATVGTQLIKRTSASTGGTPSAQTNTAHDSNSAAGTAVVNNFAANPSPLGSSAGVVRSGRLGLGTSGVLGEPLVWDFTTRNSQGLVLRGVAQSLNLNWNGAAVPAGTLLYIGVEWTEE